MRGRRVPGRLGLLAVAAAQALLGIAPLAAQAVPAGEQAAMFGRIFGYDRALSAPVTVLVVHPAGAAAQAGELVAAFSAAGITASPVAAGDLAARLGEAAVVYFLPGTTSAEAARLVSGARLLSLAGDVRAVEEGRASVGLAAAGGRTEIVVNLPRLREEGHELSAQLLKLARVVTGAPAAGGGALHPPRLVAFDTPEYPDLARRLRVQGDVVLELTVETDGSVSAVELVQGVTQKVGINEAALAAARGARFQPATRDGQPVQSVYTLSIPFRL
jgi:TonB family protein